MSNSPAARKKFPEDSSAAQTAAATHYPVRPDKRGIARLTYKRKSVYLGPYGSPASYINYALWRLRLLETGESVQITELAPMVDSIVKLKDYRRPRAIHSIWLVMAVLAVGAMLAGANYWGWVKYAEHKRPEIDGVPLADMEIAGLRRTRQWAAPDPDKSALATEPYKDGVGSGPPAQDARTGGDHG